MATTLNTTFKLKRGLSERWLELNPVLEQGEPGFEYDTFKLKIGNGIAAWVDLPYVNEEFYLSPDNSSLTVNSNGDLIVYGFEEAEIGQIPMKSADGTITWVNLSPVATSGLIEDLRQNEVITFYGGSAFDNI